MVQNPVVLSIESGIQSGTQNDDHDEDTIEGSASPRSDDCDPGPRSNDTDDLTPSTWCAEGSTNTTGEGSSLEWTVVEARRKKANLKNSVNLKRVRELTLEEKR